MIEIAAVVLLVFALLIIWCRKELKEEIRRRLSQNSNYIVFREMRVGSERYKPWRRERRILAVLFVASLGVLPVVYFLAPEAVGTVLMVVLGLGGAVVALNYVTEVCCERD